MWRILKADDTLYVRASGVDCGFLVAIDGTSFLRRKTHQKRKRKIGTLIYDVGEA